nr:hypothetical protein GCM10020093_083620 [Planobispora longispora]
MDCARAKCVALTYDDGPGPGTGALLDVLAEHGARATFFAVGTNAAAQPDLLRRMSREGHLVANHTWSHRDLTSLPTSKIAYQLGRAQEAITRATGQAPTLMRPPYGATDEKVAEVAAEMGLSVIRWSVDPADLRDPDPGSVARRAVAEAEPGAIILMHDVRRTAADATPRSCGLSPRRATSSSRCPNCTAPPERGRARPATPARPRRRHRDQCHSQRL